MSALEQLQQDIKAVGDKMMGKPQNSPESIQYAKMMGEAIDKYVISKLTELEIT